MDDHVRMDMGSNLQMLQAVLMYDQRNNVILTKRAR